jgi:hypothetical protein
MPLCSGWFPRRSGTDRPLRFQVDATRKEDRRAERNIDTAA